jgi:hypothetical protein
MEEEDRRIRRAQARAEGRRLEVQLSDAEAEWMNHQRPEQYLSDWTDAERERFTREQERLWAMIPEQFRLRAEKLAKGGF